MPGKLSEKLQKFPFAKMIYPIITLIFVVIVLILFSKTIFFLSTSINKIFSDSSASLKKEITKFDLENYELIRKRLGWPEIKIPVAAATSTVKITPSKTESLTPALAKPASSPEKKADTPQKTAEKAIIKIKIFNGPGGAIPGESLQSALDQAGFTGSQIDNHQLILKNTIVQFKTSNPNLQKYSEEIKKIIFDKYPSQAGSELPEDTDYDVSILIGKK